MKQSRTSTIRSFAIIFIIVYSIMPFVARAVSSYLTTYFYMLFILVFMASVVGGQNEIQRRDYIPDLMPFIMYWLITHFNSTDNILLWGYRFLLFLVPVVIGIHITFYCQAECERYSKVILWAIIITSITTTRGLYVYPDAARWLATVEDMQDAKLIQYGWMNLGGYNFIYTSVLLYPLIILAYKKGKLSLLKALILAVIIFACLIRADYTIALLLFVATSGMFFMKKNLSSKGLITFMVITILFIFFFSDMVSNTLSHISKNVESQNLSTRISALAGGKEGLEGLEDKRFELYLRSLTTFAKNPLFGSSLKGGVGLGHHSTILDMLGRYGLCGALVLYFMYRKLYRLFYRKYHDEEDFGYIIWIFTQVIFLAVLNNGLWLEVVAFYAPVVLQMLYDGGTRHEEDSLDREYTAQSNTYEII